MPVMHSLYREAGEAHIDPEACTHCGICARTCPADALRMDEGIPRVHEDSAHGCVACAHCMMVCPEEAITVTGRGLSSSDMVPLPAEEEKAGADALAALMQGRRSVRRFKDQEVAPELLERIVEMAATAPMNVPPWDVGCVTVRGREEVQRLTTTVVQGYEGFLSLFKPWLLMLARPFIGKTRYDMFAHFVRPLAEVYVGGYREGRDLVHFDAPALLIFHHSPYAESTDAMIACTYAMLAAESLGLGTTMIGGSPPILQRDKALCQRLGIPDGNTPSIVLILGYPAMRFLRGVRRHFSSVSTVG